VQVILEGDASLEIKLNNLPFSALAVTTGETPDDSIGSDVLYCYPKQSCIIPGRGAFLTLNHLLPGLLGSECKRFVC